METSNFSKEARCISGSLRAAGMRLIYADRPTGEFSRSDMPYARAAERMLARENAQKLPVFALGISRGTISAVNVGARLPLAGLILLSTVTGSTFDGTIYDVPVADVTAPSLLILHRQDACVSSKSESSLKSFASRTNRSTATIVVLDGGMDEAPGGGRAASCHPKSYHGFNGIDDDVAHAIMSWIDDVLRR